MVKHTFRRGVLERMNAIAEIELGMMSSWHDYDGKHTMYTRAIWCDYIHV